MRTFHKSILFTNTRSIFKVYLSIVAFLPSHNLLHLVYPGRPWSRPRWIFRAPKSKANICALSNKCSVNSSSITYELTLLKLKRRICISLSTPRFPNWKYCIRIITWYVYEIILCPKLFVIASWNFSSFTKRHSNYSTIQPKMHLHAATKITWKLYASKTFQWIYIYQKICNLT